MDYINEIKQVKKQIDPQEHGRTGYFENLIDEDLGLQPGEVGWFYDRHDRFVVVMATTVGNIIFFQRYTGRLDLIVSNSPRNFERLIPNPIHDWYTIFQYAGFGANNFHEVVESIRSAA